MPVAGIFFDLGGTLFSYRNVAQTNVPILIEASAKLGVETDPNSVKQAYATASREVFDAYTDRQFYLHRELFRDMFARCCEHLDVEFSDEVFDWYIDVHREANINCLELKHDCIDTLTHLRSAGLYLSIVSNIDDDMLVPLVEREGLHQHFDHWTSSEEAQSCKPDRRFFELALAKSGLDPSDVLFVGDSPEHDIDGAYAAGMQTVLIIEDGVVPPFQTGREAMQADHVISTLGELKHLIE